MTTTKAIIAGGGGDPNFATMALAEAGLVTFDAGNNMFDPWVFEVTGLITETANTTWSGTYGGLSATNTITIRPASGQGHADLHDYSSDPLDSDTSSGGAGFTDNAAGRVWNFKDFMVIEKLVFVGTRSAFATNIEIGDFTSSSATVVFNKNICRFIGYNGRQAGLNIEAANISTGSIVVANNLIIGTDNYQTPLVRMLWGDTYFVANTFVVVGSSPSPSDSGAGTFKSDEVNSETQFFYQNAVYHFQTANTFTWLLSRAGISTGGYNIQNGAGSGGSALPSTGGGSTSGVLSSDFTNVANAGAGDSSGTYDGAYDFRPKAAGLLLAFIPVASRYTGNSDIAATDIRGQTRVGVDNDCGCFQKTVAAAADTLMGQALL